MSKSLAVPAKKLGESELVEVLPRRDISVVPETSMNRAIEAKVDPTAEFTVRMDWEEVKLTAARLYGRGFKRAQIARALLEVLVPAGTKARTDEQKMSSARAKLRRWERNQEFRDLVYQYAVVDLDMSTPGILVGLAKRAKRGRVDAARLALELTGRHSRNEDASSPAQVTVNLIGVARPE
jgi:hypothetical protein